MANKRWKPKTLSKYISHYNNFQDFCESEDLDMSTSEFDCCLYLFAMYEAERVRYSTVYETIAGLKSVFRYLFLWKCETPIVDGYLNGLSKEKSHEKPAFMAPRVSAVAAQKLLQIGRSTNRVHENFPYVTCAIVQLDLFCRISNLLGEYAVTWDSVLGKEKEIFYKQKSSNAVPFFIVLRGGKTIKSSTTRVLSIDSVETRNILSSYMITRKQPDSPKEKLFEFNNFSFNKFLHREIETTSHALRSLGARLALAKHGEKYTMARGGWTTKESFNRYINS